jgi:hypothetical protein
MPGIRVALAAVADVSHDARVIEDVLGDVCTLYNGSSGTFLPVKES